MVSVSDDEIKFYDFDTGSQCIKQKTVNNLYTDAVDK